ncbi:MAG: WGR domain-containing protein [Pirellulales bacterium]
MHRRFEFVGGSSAKFWEVSVAGSHVTVRFGRIGADGQTQTKYLANDQQAQQHAEKLVSQKLAKGYVEYAVH